MIVAATWLLAILAAWVVVIVASVRRVGGEFEVRLIENPIARRVQGLCMAVLFTLVGLVLLVGEWWRGEK